MYKQNKNKIFVALERSCEHLSKALFSLQVLSNINFFSYIINNINTKDWKLFVDNIDCNIYYLLFFLLLSINKQKVLLLANREDNNLFLCNNNLLELLS